MTATRIVSWKQDCSKILLLPSEYLNPFVIGRAANIMSSCDTCCPVGKLNYNSDVCCDFHILTMLRLNKKFSQ